MNVILFDPAELELPLPRSDRRAVHILQILRRQVGDSFDVGVINGRQGRATVTAISDHALQLSFSWDRQPSILSPLVLIVGLPRPQTVRDILRDATSIGVAEIHFVRTEKSDPSYAQSTLWSSGEWRRHAIAGAEQAFESQIPEVRFGHPLPEALASLRAGSNRFALDNYEASQRLSEVSCSAPASILAVGGERGWSATERDVLRAQKFTLVNLGSRVLRTETACVAALSILRAKLGLM